MSSTEPRVRVLISINTRVVVLAAPTSEVLVVLLDPEILRVLASYPPEILSVLWVLQLPPPERNLLQLTLVEPPVNAIVSHSLSINSFLQKNGDTGHLLLRSVFFEFRRNFTETRKICGGSYYLLVSCMFHEVATLVDLIESSKPAAREQAVRWIVPLKVF